MTNVWWTVLQKVSIKLLTKDTILPWIYSWQVQCKPVMTQPSTGSTVTKADYWTIRDFVLMFDGRHSVIFDWPYSFHDLEKS